MKNTAKIKTLPWKLIIVLGVIALVRPAIKIVGDFTGFDVTPLATLTITAVIAIIWIAVVVALRVKRPVYVLAAAGVVYAVASIMIAVLIQGIAPGAGSSEASIPVLLTAGLVGTTVYNLVYGAFLGFIANIIQKIKV